MNTRCNGPTCDAPLVWARTAKGSRMPFDQEPTEDGRWKLVHDQPRQAPLAVHVAGADLDEARREHASRVEKGMAEPGPLRLYVPHHSTCPDARKFRRKGSK